MIMMMRPLVMDAGKCHREGAAETSTFLAVPEIKKESCSGSLTVLAGAMLLQNMWRLPSIMMVNRISHHKRPVPMRVEISLQELTCGL